MTETNVIQIIRVKSGFQKTKKVHDEKVRAVSKICYL